MLSKELNTMKNASLNRISRWFICTLGVGLLVAASAASAQQDAIGKVLYVKGVTTAHQEGSSTRFLGKGADLFQGDVVTTSARSFAIIETTDKGRVSLRPSTVFKVETFDYKPEAEPEESNSLIRLFKGGFRAVTGLITKRNPERGMRVVTPVATLGIRGTDFNVRHCTDDCAKEQANMKPVKVTRPRVIARMAFVRGKVSVHAEDGSKRPILTGGALFRKDEVETGPNASAVVVFRDNTRITVRPGTTFTVERYRFRDKEPERNNAFFRLVRGGLRILTGLVGKQDHRQFKLNTPVAVVGVRGTNFDVRCEGECAATQPQAQSMLDGLDWLRNAIGVLIKPAFAQSPFNFNRNLAVYTREGETNIQRPGQQPFPIPAGRVGALPVGGGAPQPRLLATVPQQFINDPNRRPETVRPQTRERFGSQRQDAPPRDSTQVRVFQGDVQLRSNVDPQAAPRVISNGESASAGANGRVIRVAGAGHPVMLNFGAKDPKTFNPETNSFEEPVETDEDSKAKREDQECVQ
ncbi:MAG: FecR family protein [Gammaproteobacteria bacterium]